MRCIFNKGKQRELLLFAKDSLGLSWRKTANALGVGYSTLRDWRDEKYAMQYSAFIKLGGMCPQCVSFGEFIAEVKEDNWGRKLGGLRTKQKRRGFFNPKYKKQSRLWKSAGGQRGLRNWHAMMKTVRPEEYQRIQHKKIMQSLKYKYNYKGQKYRNILELDVAKILTENGYKFEYERLLKCGDKVYFPDFIVDKTIIECTYWHDTEKRAQELRQKIENYLKLGLKTVLVVTTQRYREKYSNLLHPNVRVITPDNLRKVLGGK
jgi:hypothetical protein